MTTLPFTNRAGRAVLTLASRPWECGACGTCGGWTTIIRRKTGELIGCPTCRPTGQRGGAR